MEKDMKEGTSVCTVVMEGETYQSGDFVAILTKEDGDASIYYDTDAMTLGMAVKLVSKEFVRCVKDLTPEERDEITSILGDAFVFDKEDIGDEERQN